MPCLTETLDAISGIAKNKIIKSMAVLQLLEASCADKSGWQC